MTTTKGAKAAVSVVAEAMERRVKRVKMMAGIAAVVAVVLAFPLVVPMAAEATGLTAPWQVGPMAWSLAGLSVLAVISWMLLRVQTVGDGPLRIFDDEMRKAVARDREGVDQVQDENRRDGS